MEAERSPGAGIISLLKATRPVNQIISVVAVLAGWIISIDRVVPDPEAVLFLLMISAFCTSGGVNLINDIRDRSIDRRAHPNRAVASGILSVHTARIISLVLLITGAISVILASVISGIPLPAAIFAGVLILDLVYEAGLKEIGLPGNIVVSVIVALSFPFGASIHGVNATVLIIFAVAFLTNLSREIIKDVQDIESDRKERKQSPCRLVRGEH